MPDSPASLEALWLAWRDGGDPRALAEVFDRLAPELLLVAAHLAGAPHDAEDIVQETFLAAIRSPAAYDESRPLRPWFVGILANQAKRLRRDRARRPDPSLVRQESPEVDPPSAASAAETAELVSRAIAGLPSRYREALTLHWLHGLTPTQIGHATGVPPATVKTRLFRARRMLESALPVGLTTGLVLALGTGGLAAVRARVLDAATGGAAANAATAAASTARTGTRIALALGGAVLVVGAIVATVLPDDDGEPGEDRSVAAAPERADDAAEPEPAAEQAPVEREPVARDEPVEAGAPGRLLVRVTFGDGTPAPDVALRAVPDAPVNAALLERRARTDAAGVADLGEFAHRSVRVSVGRGGAGEAKIQPGSSTTFELGIPEGLDVTGRVFGADGEPLADAELLVAAGGSFDDPLVAARTSSDGSYTIRDLSAGHAISARAPMHATAPLRVVDAEAAEGLEIRLAEPGLRVTGRVLDPDGRPLAGARVLVGTPFDDEARSRADAAAGRRPPEWLWSDENGAFCASSVPPEPETILWARAFGHAPQSGSIVLDPHRGADVNAQLPPGASLVGRLLGPDGAPAGGVEVTIRDSTFDRPELGVPAPMFGRSVARTAADGTFRVDGLLPRPLQLTAEHDGLRAVAVLVPRAGEELRWDGRLGESATLWGIVVDGSGAPVPGMQVEAQVDAPLSPPPPAVTGADGRFESDTTPDATHRLLLRPSGGPWDSVCATVEGVSAADSPLRVVLPPTAVPSAAIEARVVGADGQPPRDCIAVLESRALEQAPLRIDPESGAVRASPLPAGSYRLRVFRRDGVRVATGDWFDAAPGSTVDAGSVEIAPEGRIVASLTDAFGQPVRQGQVDLRLEDGSTVASVVIRDGTGSASVPSGTYRIADPECIGPAPWGVVDVAPGAETDVTVVREASVPRTFELRHADDGQDLRVAYTVEKEGEVITRWRGAWKRGGNREEVFGKMLSPGSWTVRVTDHAGRSADVSFDVRPDDRPEDRVVLPLK